MLLGLCPSIVGYCLSVCYWVGYVYCPSVITWVSLITGYSLSIVVGGRYLSVCYWVCVHQLLVNVCPYVIG